MTNELDHIIVWKKYFDTFLHHAHNKVNQYNMFKPTNPSDEAEFETMKDLVERAKRVEPHYPDVPRLDEIKKKLRIAERLNKYFYDNRGKTVSESVALDVLHEQDMALKRIVEDKE